MRKKLIKWKRRARKEGQMEGKTKEHVRKTGMGEKGKLKKNIIEMLMQSEESKLCED